MKLFKINKSDTLFLVAILLTTTFVSIPVYAQEIGNVRLQDDSHPTIRKFIFENDRVRISEIRLKPGQKSELLNFDLPGYMYIAKPGKLRFYWENKRQDLKVDDNGSVLSIIAHHWTESEPPHSVVNVGNKEFLAIRFEVKPFKQ